MLQGFGAGALQPVTTTITGDIYTLKERPSIQAITTGVWGAANVLGPVIGGWIVMHTSWRWVFLVNVPVGALAAFLLVASYRDPPRAVASHAFDWQGPLLIGAPIALTLLALEPGTFHGLTRAWIALAAIVGVGLFLHHQRRVSTPLIPMRLLRDRTVLTGLIAGAFVGALLYTASAFLPLYVSESGHHTPVVAGFALVPLLFGWAIESPIGVRVLIRSGMRASVGGGMLIAFAGATLLALMVAWDAPLPGLAFAAFVLGLGLGPTGATSTVAPQTRVLWSERGLVTSTIFGTRMLGGSLGVGIVSLAHGHFAGQFALMSLIAGLAAFVTLQLAPGPERAPAMELAA